MNKKIETYEKVISALENIIAFERQTGFIKSMLQDKEQPDYKKPITG